MKYFLHLAYQGTAYHGWQRQTSAVSVQSTIEGVLSEVCKQAVTVNGCGRTDAGVHASQYVCSIELTDQSSAPDVYVLNRRLPADISVFEVIPVAGSANPRYDATLRTYDYFMHRQKIASLAQTSTWINAPALDLAAMRSVLPSLTGRKDFRAYCKVPDRHDHTICDVQAVNLWASGDQQFIRLQFTSNRFLRGMIRLLVGNLLEVGKGRQTPELFIQRLEEQITPPFAKYAPPQGLYLSRVAYPYLSLKQEDGLQGLKMLTG